MQLRDILDASLAVNNELEVTIKSNLDAAGLILDAALKDPGITAIDAAILRTLLQSTCGDDFFVEATLGGLAAGAGEFLPSSHFIDSICVESSLEQLAIRNYIVGGYLRESCVRVTISVRNIADVVMFLASHGRMIRDELHPRAYLIATKSLDYRTGLFLVPPYCQDGIDTLTQSGLVLRVSDCSFMLNLQWRP